MCGIMGYVGPRPATPILLDGLRRLEYRGYDSAGIAVADHGRIAVLKAEGKLDRLVAMAEQDGPSGTVGMGHTRWATHGGPTDTNAHPHTDESGDFVVIHNGIIENFLPLKRELLERGHRFSSETDTEVLAHLVEEEYAGDVAEAVRKAVARARGAYALVVMGAGDPGRIVAVRMISPLVVGFGEGEMLLASDIPALLPHTKRVLIVEDGEMATLTADGVAVERLDGTPVERDPIEVTWDAGEAERGGYSHFMLKEIFEQPRALQETMMGRLEVEDLPELDDLDLSDEFLADLRKIWVTACGTAFHAGLYAKEILEGLVRVPVEAAYAHELRYRDPLIEPGSSLALAISQSGETADTLAAARLVGERGARLMAITNVVGSTLSREADRVLYTRAGPEIAVASTKAYLTMLICEAMLAVWLGRRLGSIGPERAAALIREMRALPTKAQEALDRREEVAEAARWITDAEDMYFIGRGLDYSAAMEGSLKLKEISYLHSEAMPAGELKHGTLALVTERTPVAAVITQSHLYDKTISAVQEVKARGARVLAVAYEDDRDVAEYADHVLAVPRTDDLLSPVLTAVPLQLLAYHVALERGHDIDQPRNLAKSVTVE